MFNPDLNETAEQMRKQVEAGGFVIMSEQVGERPDDVAVTQSFGLKTLRNLPDFILIGGDAMNAANIISSVHHVIGDLLNQFPLFDFNSPVHINDLKLRMIDLGAESADICGKQYELAMDGKKPHLVHLQIADMNGNYPGEEGYASEHWGAQDAEFVRGARLLEAAKHAVKN